MLIYNIRSTVFFSYLILVVLVPFIIGFRWCTVMGLFGEVGMLFNFFNFFKSIMSRLRWLFSVSHKDIGNLNLRKFVVLFAFSLCMGPLLQQVLGVKFFYFILLLFFTFNLLLIFWEPLLFLFYFIILFIMDWVILIISLLFNLSLFIIGSVILSCISGFINTGKSIMSHWPTIIIILYFISLLCLPVLYYFLVDSAYSEYSITSFKSYNYLLII